MDDAISIGVYLDDVFDAFGAAVKTSSGSSFRVSLTSTVTLEPSGLRDESLKLDDGVSTTSSERSIPMTASVSCVPSRP